MSLRQFPKAYLRLDPNIDHKHPDNLDAFVRLLCAANRQTPRGRFRNRAVLESLFGKPTTHRYFNRGDVRMLVDGTVDVVGWDAWQEGDLDVAERMRRYRESKTVTEGVTDTVTEPVTEPVTEGVTKPLPTSETFRRKDVKTLDALKGAPRAREADPYDAPEMEALGWLARHGCSLSETSGHRRKLIELVERFGTNAVIGKFDRLSSAGVMDGDVRGFVFGAADSLYPKADVKALEREDRAEEASAAFDRGVARTRREIARTYGHDA